MCDPISLAVGAIGGMVASKALSPKQAAAPAQAAVDPAEERAKAEGDAAQKANARLAEDQRRRREQSSLMARGAPSFSLGDAGADGSGTGASPIGPSSRPTTRNTVAKQSSLMSQGAPAGGGYGGGGGGGRNYSANLL